ncbi:MAG: hypothetical protein AAGG53_03010 [Cyanobacteria bacterium P01_H01_bin.152]
MPTQRRMVSPRIGNPLVHHQPSGSKIRLNRSRQRLSLYIPPTGLRGEAASIAIFALFWNGFIFVWTSAALLGGAPIFFVLFSLPFWAIGAGMMWMVLNALAMKTRLEVEGDRFFLTRQLFNWKQEHTGAARDLYGVELTTAYTQNSRPVKTIALSAGTQIHKFGTTLSNPEKAWVVSEIQAFITDQATV